MIRNVDGSVDAFEYHEIAFNLFGKGKIFDIYVSCSSGGLLSVAHCCTAVVVFEEDRGCFLWNVKIPENAAYKKDHFSSIVCGHKLGLGGRTCTVG